MLVYAGARGSLPWAAVVLQLDRPGVAVGWFSGGFGAVAAQTPRAACQWNRGTLVRISVAWRGVPQAFVLPDAWPVDLTTLPTADAGCLLVATIGQGGSERVALTAYCGSGAFDCAHYEPR